jgi:plastocyanin
VGIAAALLPLTAGRSQPREIVLVARDMGFFVAGTATSNPLITIKRGEEIALTLRNEDPGIIHDFVIPAWNVKTRRLQGDGSDRVVFTVPDEAGSVDYLCTPHAAMMYGKIAVQ